MVAGFKRDICSRSLGLSTRRSECVDFSVRGASIGVVSFTHDIAPLHYNASDSRVGLCQTLSPLSKLKSSGHELFIRLFHIRTKRRGPTPGTSACI